MSPPWTRGVPRKPAVSLRAWRCFFLSSQEAGPGWLGWGRAGSAWPALVQGPRRGGPGGSRDAQHLRRTASCSRRRTEASSWWMAAWDGVQAWLWVGMARSSRVRGSPSSLGVQLPRPHRDMGSGHVCPLRGARPALGMTSGQGVSLASSWDRLRLADGQTSGHWGRGLPQGITWGWKLSWGSDQRWGSVPLRLRLLCWALPWGLPPRGCRLRCCWKRELISRPVVSIRARPGLGPGPVLARLLWTLQGSWWSAAPGEGVAAGPPFLAWHSGTHRPCLLARPTSRLFWSLRCSKEKTDSHVLGVVSARERQGPTQERASVSSVVQGRPVDTPGGSWARTAT